MGAQLKKVERPEAPAVETSNPLFGGNPGINEILERYGFTRSRIQRYLFWRGDT